MLRLLRKPIFWIASLIIATCLVFAVINLMEVRTRTNVVMIAQQVLDREQIRGWLKEQKRRGPFDLKGWDILEESSPGTYIVSYTITREDPERRRAPLREGFWFRVNPEERTCEPLPCPDTES